MADILNKIVEAVKKGMNEETVKLVKEGLDSKIEPKKILDEGLIRGMNEVGVMFERNEAFIPDMLIASRAMKQGMEKLKPYLKGGRSDTLGKIIVGTVKGDLHDIGKNLVSIFYESVGFEVIDLGTDVTADKFIEAIDKNNAKIVSLSALLTTTMINQAETLKEIKSRYGNKVAVLVGGAPVTQEWADSVGADGYSPNAYGACKIASSIMR